MADERKRLGAFSIVSGEVIIPIYKVPAGKSAVVSSFTICNRSSIDRTVRIAHINNGNVGDVANEDYILFDFELPANDTFAATIGLCMAENDTLAGYASSGEVSFIVWGNEIT